MRREMAAAQGGIPDISHLNPEMRSWIRASCPSSLGPRLTIDCMRREMTAVEAAVPHTSKPASEPRASIQAPRGRHDRPRRDTDGRIGPPAPHSGSHPTSGSDRNWSLRVTIVQLALQSLRYNPGHVDGQARSTDEACHPRVSASGRLAHRRRQITPRLEIALGSALALESKEHGRPDAAPAPKPHVEPAHRAPQSPDQPLL